MRTFYFAAVVTIFFPFFLAYSQPSHIGCLLYFHAWCGLSANLECRSEMCCTQLAENTDAKNRHLRTIAQLCRGISLQRRHASTVRKKQQYLLHMSSKYGELWPTISCDRLASLGHPSKFHWISRLGFITATTSLSGS